MDDRAVRRWFGKPGRRWWHVLRLTATLSEAWDPWFGQLTLTGVDPRTWDLSQLLAAFEATLRQNAKDEAAWNRTRQELEAEPKEVRAARIKASRAGDPAARNAGRMNLTDARALLAGFAAEDAKYG